MNYRILLFVALFTTSGCAANNHVYRLRDHQIAELMQSGYRLGEAKQKATAQCMNGNNFMCAESARIDRVNACVERHWMNKDVVARCAVAFRGPEPRL